MRRHRQWIVGLLAAAAAFGAAGCATRQVRNARAPAPGGVYPAVRKDAEIVGACFAGDTGFHASGVFGKAIGYTVVPICWLLDMPLSAVTDTAWLAADLRAAKSGKVAPSEELPKR